MNLRQLLVSASSLVALFGANAHADFGVYTCTTVSNGYDFTYDSRDASHAKNSVMANCRAHLATSNAECNANIACNDGQYYPEFTTCDTFSRGYTFQEMSRDPELAASTATAACRAHSATSNADCNANIACSIYGHPPVPPAPPAPTPGYCPDPNTYFDASLGRCVSRTTPTPAPAPGYCPDPSTYWDARIGRCVSGETDRGAPRPRPRPIPAQVTCSIYSFSFTSHDAGAATREVLRQCAAASRGYVCRGSDVVCR